MSATSKFKLLSAGQLIERADRQHELESKIMNRGLKCKHPQNTPEELAKVKSYQDDLRQVLSMERILKKGVRSTASLINGQIKITKRIGKWNLIDSYDYLQPHEALFLMEMSRLEICIDSMIVSLERAYQIFLADPSEPDSEKLTLAEYLVYSHFARIGCNVKKFIAEKPHAIESGSLQSNATSAEHVCTWNYLYKLLGHRKQISESFPNDEIDDRIKTSMNNIVKSFRPTVTDSDRGSINPRKRRMGSDSNTWRKFRKLIHNPEDRKQYFGSGSTNDFMGSQAFEKFNQIFKEIDVIDVKAPDSIDASLPNRLKFSFDFWLSTDYQRTKYCAPNIRVIVSNSPKSLPHSDDVLRLYNSQIHKAAIIVVCLNEEMSFQAFIYRFTT